LRNERYDNSSGIYREVMEEDDSIIVLDVRVRMSIIIETRLLVLLLDVDSRVQVVVVCTVCDSALVVLLDVKVSRYVDATSISYPAYTNKITVVCSFTVSSLDGSNVFAITVSCLLEQDEILSGYQSSGAAGLVKGEMSVVFGITKGELMVFLAGRVGRGSLHYDGRLDHLCGGQERDHDEGLE
jgi:hypothetical protein